MVKTSSWMKRGALGAGLALGITGAATAAPVFMSAEWAGAACDAWNADPVLTDELGASGWIENNKDRGYKIMQIYRLDCPESPRVELRMEPKDGKAWCVAGGPVTVETLDDDADYVMFAEDERWKQMGAGEYGPMKAMMFGRLKFEGPKWEAMKNMGPFENFLLLTGKVESDRSSCP